MQDLVSKARSRPLGVSGYLEQRGQYRQALKEWQKQQKQPQPTELPQKERKVTAEEGEYRWYLKPEFLFTSPMEQAKLLEKTEKMTTEQLVAKYGDEKMPGTEKTYREAWEELQKAISQEKERMERSREARMSRGLGGGTYAGRGGGAFGAGGGKSAPAISVGSGSVGYGSGFGSPTVSMGSMAGNFQEQLQQRYLWDIMHDVATPEQWQSKLGDRYDDYLKAEKAYQYGQYRSYASRIQPNMKITDNISDNEFLLAKMPKEARDLIVEFESSPEYEEYRKPGIELATEYLVEHGAEPESQLRPTIVPRSSKKYPSAKSSASKNNSLIGDTTRIIT